MQNELKSREVEILRLMNEGLTNREIGERLYIGVETVRWYAKQIYSKLDVAGRQAREEAIDRAQSLGLLGTTESPEKIRLDSRSSQNLPAQLNAFIGRETHIEALKKLLAKGRLLTLTGPGGTGKTRLSIRVAEDLLAAFSDGVYFIDLAPVSESELVASAIANTLTISESGDQPVIEAVKRAIGQREMLLILDNYEHVIEAASLVAELLTTSPNIKVIVTSREPLRVTGEQVYPVPPLTLPEDHEFALSEAVSLFVQRSQSVRPSFQLSEMNAAAVAEICQRLDGMPLAIELAAALSRLLTPEAILARMDKRFQILSSGPRDAPARQQTLGNTIDWSYNLLNEDEKRLFACLSVFRGGRSLEAIEHVCSDQLPSLFEVLSALVDKSMIRQIDDELGEPRFVMLETLQEYASERLEHARERQVLGSRHAHYFASLTDHARRYLRQRGQEYWFPKLSIEQENIRIALQWSLFGGDPEVAMRIVDNMRDFWFYQGSHVEGLRWSQLALEHLEDVEPLLQVGVLHTASEMNEMLLKPEALVLLKRALEIAEEYGYEHKSAWILIQLAQQMYNFSSRSYEDYDEALSICTSGITIFRRLGDKIGLAQGFNILGNLYRAHGHFLHARDAYNECLNLCYETGEQRRVAMQLGNLCIVASELRNYDEAERLAHATIRLLHELGFTYMTVLNLGLVVPVALAKRGEFRQAAKILGASVALRDAMNVYHQASDLSDFENIRDEVRQQLGEATYQTEYEAGRAMSLAEAVEFALRETEQH